MSAQPTVYVVTGGGRGIGLAFVQALAARPNTVVYAGVRSFPPAADSELGKLAASKPDVCIPIKITSGDEEDNAAAAATIKAKYGKGVSVVIANAGIQTGMNPIQHAKMDDFIDNFKINTLSPVLLLQKLSPLLLPGGKFIAISSQLGQITDAAPYPFSCYGASKAALNYVMKKADMESPGVTIFPIHPGGVKTQMTLDGLKEVGMKPEDVGAIEPEESVAGMLDVIDKATKESHGGKFWDYKGEQMTF